MVYEEVSSELRPVMRSSATSRSTAGSFVSVSQVGRARRRGFCAPGLDGCEGQARRRVSGALGSATWVPCATRAAVPPCRMPACLLGQLATASVGQFSGLLVSGERGRL